MKHQRAHTVISQNFRVHLGYYEKSEQTRGEAKYLPPWTFKIAMDNMDNHWCLKVKQ